MFIIYPNLVFITQKRKENEKIVSISFQQTLKDVENVYRDIACFDMSYNELKEVRREEWKTENNTCLHFDRSKKREEKISFVSITKKLSFNVP